MVEAEIPEPVRAFIAAHIDSVVQLEILLLLHQSSSRAFAAEDVARELRIEPAWAGPCLADLSARGMLVAGDGADPKYRFQPSSPGLQETIDQVSVAYATHRVRVTTLIFAKPPGALRSFSDAFRIRRDRSNG
ncbi:MAG TPA: hypothetical protein VGG44_05240 [Tepidisphaeraceae bacterium]